MWWNKKLGQSIIHQKTCWPYEAQIEIEIKDTPVTEHTADTPTNDNDLVIVIVIVVVLITMALHYTPR